MKKSRSRRLNEEQEKKVEERARKAEEQKRMSEEGKHERELKALSKQSGKKRNGQHDPQTQQDYRVQR